MAEMVKAAKDKHLSLKVRDGGYDIYAPRVGQTWGYRYGPSIMQYGDGKIDAWFASPGAAGEADWFTYKHSEDDGETWSREVVVLTPTADSLDFFSVCDPAVIRFGGYYYIGYTSTIFANGGGVCNNGFVARSKNPDGPFYKWTGSGWGEERTVREADGTECVLRWMGKPAPVIYYDEPWQNWGAGEFSFVKVGDVLYIYYTWASKDSDGRSFSQTRVATADATREDWPRTIQNRGVAIERTGSGNDSTDVIYLEEYEKFAAIATDRRFTPDSVLVIYESNDGLQFTPVNYLRTHIGFKCHNAGISGGPEHRISCQDDVLIGYAYGDKWGYWGTRFHKAHFFLTDEPDFSDASKPNVERTVRARSLPDYKWAIHVTTVPHFYECHASDAPFEIELAWLDTRYVSERITDPAEVRFSNYDGRIVAFDGLRCVPKGVGYTYVDVEYEGRRTEFLVYVREDSETIRDPEKKIVSFTPMLPEYVLPLSGHFVKQIRGLAVYSDHSWFEICEAKDGVSYTVADPYLLSIREDGCISHHGIPGETTVTVSCGGLHFDVKVRVE